MALYHQSELDSGVANSVTSSPRSDYTPRSLTDDYLRPCFRFMCSFGGRILPRPHDNQLRYVGGDTRIVSVHRTISFSSLLSKLSKLSGTADVSVKYQLPNEDLDALISVTTDEDIDNMMEEYDRNTHSVNPKSARLRLFLFPPAGDESNAGSIGSLLHSSSRREHWFFDALNGGGGSGFLERGRSEVSSIISELPDYLFGLDSSEDPKPKTRTVLTENVSVSDPGSPVPVTSSSYCSTLSSHFLPSITDLPPVKTKLENPIQPAIVEPSFPQQAGTGYPGNPVWHYVPESHFTSPAVPPVPVYYMLGPGQVPVPSGNVQVQTIPMPAPYLQQFQAPAGQIPIGFRHAIPGQTYGGVLKPVTSTTEVYELPTHMIGDGGAQQVHYRAENVVPVPTIPQR